MTSGSRPGWVRLGELLCRRRRALHIPINDVARATGYRYVQISEAENGNGCPSERAKLTAWCAAVGLPIDDALAALGDDAPFLSVTVE